MWGLLIACFLVRSHHPQDNPVQPTATPPSDHVEKADVLVEKDENQATKNEKKKKKKEKKKKEKDQSR